MKEKATTRLMFTLSMLFGFYFAFIGIWYQIKIVGIPAFIFLILLFTLGLKKEKE